MPNPVYLQPGVDPTQIERPLAQPGCFRWIWLIVLLIGGCGGFSVATGLFAHPTPPATPTPSATRTGTLQPSPTFTATPTATHEQISIYTLAPTELPAATEQVCWYYHRITQGETLSGLAAHFGVPINTIQNWNSITNPNRILYGFSLRIKTTCSTPTAAATDNVKPIPQQIGLRYNASTYF